MLRLFDLIYSTGSVTRAAEMMGQRQPTASIWLRTVFVPATSTRTFCICMPDASQVTLLPELLAHLRAVAPGVRLVATRKQHWHERYHEDAGNRWLRSELAGLFMQK